MEIEMHLLDNNGNISNESKKIIEKVKDVNEKIPITKECGQNMIEFGCYPNINTISPALELVDSIETANDILEKNDLKFYPFATYPGKFNPVFNSSTTYDIKQKLFGERFAIAPTVTGFHHHYTLPKGIFNQKEKNLRLFKDSKLKRSLINSYNLEISIDPLLTLFTQSSPFYQGKLFAKDSRVVVYRGGKKLQYVNSLYGGKFRTLGNLQSYVHTQTDLMLSLRRKYLKMRRLVKSIDKKIKFDEVYPYPLEIGWNPVKINKHGTLEQRGMDMNLLSNLFGVSTMLKYNLRKIQREYIEVIPADNGLEEAFKVEGGVMYIPPYSTVLNLQKRSAYQGFQSQSIYKYAKKFFNYSKSIVPRKYQTLLRPIEEMIENKKTVSDNIMAYAKRKGFIQDGNISQNNARDLALYSNELFLKDNKIIKDKLGSIRDL